MCELKSYWELEGDLPKFPSRKALMQEFRTILNSIEPKMTSGLFWAFHVVNGKRVSTFFIVIEPDGNPHFSRPQRL